MCGDNEVPALQWLAARGSSVSELARRLKRPRETVRDAVMGSVVPRTDVAYAIVEFSKKHPGPNGEVVGYRELSGVEG